MKRPGSAGRSRHELVPAHERARKPQHEARALECGSLLPPLGCGYLQGASKLAHFKAPFGRIDAKRIRSRHELCPRTREHANHSMRGLNTHTTGTQRLKTWNPQGGRSTYSPGLRIPSPCRS